MAIHPEMKEIAVVLPWHEQDFDEIMFIDPISGKLLRSVKRSYTQEDLGRDHNFIDAMHYSPDGNQLVILDKGTKYVAKTHRFVFLNPRDGEVLHKFEVPATIPEITYTYSPNGQWFVFPRRGEGGEGRIDAINTTDWKSIETFKFVGSAFWKAPVTFSPNGRYLAYGNDVWDFQTAEVVHTNGVGRFSRFLNDTQLLTSDLASIELWEIEQDELLQTAVIRPATSSWSAYFLPEDATILATGRSLSLQNAVTGNLIKNGIFENEFYPRIVAISPVSSHVAVPSSSRKEIRIWDATAFQVIHRLPFPDKKPRVLAFSPDGKQLAIGESSYITRLWNISTGKEVHRFVNRDKIIDRLKSAFVRALAFTPDGKQLACGGTFDAIWLWDVRTGKRNQKLDLPTDLTPVNASGEPVEKDWTRSVMFLRFDSSGKRLFVGLASGHFLVFDLVGGMVLKTLHPGYQPKTPDFDYPIDVAINPDASLIAVGRKDYVIELIETLRWQSVAELKGHRGHIGSLDFSHDGTKLLSKSGDGTMRVWKVERGWLSKAWLKIEKQR